MKGPKKKVWSFLKNYPNKIIYCDGPLLGHMEVKYPRLDYDSVVVKRYEGHLKGFEEFKSTKVCGDNNDGEDGIK